MIPVPFCLQRFAAERRWVVWSDLSDKSPKQINGKFAASNDPSTWYTLAEVQSAVESGRFTGIGINMRGLNGVIGIDLDGARNIETGLPNAGIAQLLSYGSYTELSPSGTGYRIFGLGKLEASFQHSFAKHVGFEVYGENDNHYLTITGNKVQEAPDALKDVTEIVSFLRQQKAMTSPSTKGPAIKQGDRSSALFVVVRDLYRVGLSIDAIEAACRTDPENTGAIKYLEGYDRLRQEIERCLSKPDEWEAAVENGRKLWEGCTHVNGKPRATHPTGRSTFRLRLASDFEASEPDWLIEGLFERGCLVLLFGDPGVGKSFLVIDWIYSVANGSEFQGRAVKQGTVIYVAGEGHRGFGRRREAWGQHYGRDTKDAPVYMSDGPANMLDAVAEVKTAISCLPEPALIVFDTLARNFGSGDENSTKDMTAFIAAIDHLRADYPDCAVLIVHHSGHTDKQRARGAMALKGAVDTEYRLEAAQKGLLLTNTKMKDGDPPEPFYMVWKSVGQSAVLVEGEGQPTGGVEKVSQQQRMALSAYVQAAVSIGHAGDDTPVPTEIWRAFFYKALGDKSQDTKKKAFKYVRESLPSKGFLVEDGEGYRPDHIRKMEIRMASSLKNVDAL